jgi:hypothetical protein
VIPVSYTSDTKFGQTAHVTGIALGYRVDMWWRDVEGDWYHESRLLQPTPSLEDPRSDIAPMVLPLPCVTLVHPPYRDSDPYLYAYGPNDEPLEERDGPEAVPIAEAKEEVARWRAAIDAEFPPKAL